MGVSYRISQVGLPIIMFFVDYTYLLISPWNSSIHRFDQTQTCAGTTADLKYTSRRH